MAPKGQADIGALKYAVVTADDFGRSPQVNRAIIQAHRDGVLTCASLMIAAPWAKEAVELAAQHPELRVGLHLVLVDGFSVLPHRKIPRLADTGGRFLDRPARAGLTYFFSRPAREQLAAECEAQLQAFCATGLVPDHLNSHHHLHIHPSIAAIVVRVARKYRIPAVRLPLQELGMADRKAMPMAAAMLPWTLLLRRRLRRRGILHNQAIFGLYETGRMDEQNWLRTIARLKPGISEIFCHPGAPGNVSGASPSPGQDAELCALTSSAIRRRLQHDQVVLTSFSQLSGACPGA